MYFKNFEYQELVAKFRHRASNRKEKKCYWVSSSVENILHP